MPGGTIFGLIPFTPKRTLILPCMGGEITLYVLDGKAYPTTIKQLGGPTRHEIREVRFSGWGTRFKNDSLNIPQDRLIDPGDFQHYELEVVFRLIPRTKTGQTAEIVAVSYDNGESFYENELCTLPSEYENPSEVLAS